MEGKDGRSVCVLRRRGRLAVGSSVVLRRFGGCCVLPLEAGASLLGLAVSLPMDAVVARAERGPAAGSFGVAMGETMSAVAAGRLSGWERGEGPGAPIHETIPIMNMSETCSTPYSTIIT